MEPQQQVPQPTNPASLPAKSNGGKIIALVVGLIIIIALAYVVLKGSNPVTPTDSDTLSGQEDSSTDTQLTQLEQENQNQDFSEVDADFGSEVNAAAQ